MKPTADNVAQAFYAYLEHRVSWEHFKRVRDEFLEVEN